MKPKSINSFAVAMLFLLSFAALSSAQSLSYSNAIANLSPAGYWPMHEVEPAAVGDVETNYGSLGVLGNAYYPDYQINSGEFFHLQPGPLGNGSDFSVCFNSAVPEGGTATNGLYVPRTSPLSTIRPPFTIEVWVMLTNNTPGQGDIISQDDSSKTTGFRFLLQNAPPSDEFNTLSYNNGGSAQDNIPSNSITGMSNVWQYLAVTVNSATNIITFLDGVQENTKSAVADFQYDTHTPFTVGTGLGFQRSFRGFISEVALYSTNLPAGDIATHWFDATNALSSTIQYSNDVVDDPNGGALIYLRMNSPAYTAPAPGIWPALVNYGQTNGVAVNNGVYTPGTMPGILSVTSYTNSPLGLIATNVALLSGVSSFADAGYAPAYNPTGPTPFSVAVLFRGNPTDTNRTESLFGHGTNSWMLGFSSTDRLVFNSGTNDTSAVGSGTGAGDLNSTVPYNDGLWHLVVATHNNTTNVLYVDGISNAVNVVGANSVGNAYDVVIGSDPCFTNTPVGFGRQFAGQICDAAFFTNALTLANVQSLFNACGIVPSILQQPVSATVNQNSSFTNTVTISTGSAPVSFQWYTNGVAFGGQTNLSLILSPVLPAYASTNYYFVAANSFGSITSKVVSLTVNSVPQFISQLPVPYTNMFTVYAGVSPVFSISAIGAQPIHYQWYTNGVAVSGATNTGFTFTNVEAAFTNYCVLTNVAGVVTSFLWSASIIPTNGLPPYPLEALSLTPAGYWRMNDPADPNNNNDNNGGVICRDYINGDDGLYTNYDLGQPGYNPTVDPSDTSAAFDVLDYFGDVNSIQAPDVSAPNGTNGEFSIAAWVNPTGYTGQNSPGIAAKGYFNQEEFTLDQGGGSGALRFEVRDASGNPYNANSAIQTSLSKYQNQWYLLVGVCDEANGNLSLYINGVLATNVFINTAAGIYNSATTPMTIGARLSTAISGINNEFEGYISDVLMYKNALTAAQVAALWQQNGLPPIFTMQPVSSTNVSYNGTLIVPAAATGGAPLSYKWYDQNANQYIAGQTNATLVLSNVTVSHTYYLTASNPYGTTNSTAVSVSTVTGQPSIYTQPQNPLYVAEGLPANNSVIAYGTAPLAYQWQIQNGPTWVNLTDNGHIIGSQNYALTISNTFATDATNYQVVVTNVFGAVTSSVAQLIVAYLPLNFYGNGQFWTLNGGATIVNGLLTLTDPGVPISDSSAFFQYPQYIGAFEASFTYQAGGNKQADGVSFCLQAEGTSALGSGGGNLGVAGITPSVELMLDIFSGSGYAIGTNGVNVPTTGAISPNFSATGNVLINSGDPINISVYYANGLMSLTFTDAVASTSFSTNRVVGDLTKVLQGTSAYVGFTGSYGGSSSVQTISNLSFVSIPTESMQRNGGNGTVSWPGGVYGFLLQQNSSLNTNNWINVANPDSVTNGQHQVVVPLNSPDQFYRLMLSQ